MIVLVFALVADVYAVESTVFGNARSRQLAKHLEQELVSGNADLSDRFTRLLSVARNDREKAWLVYRWVAQHFRHDTQLAREIGDPSRRSLEYLHQVGGGSCAVYANVVYRLMQMAGLEVRTIYGLAKGGVPTARRNGKPVNHVWNALRLNGEWLLVDATWGSGYVDREGFKPEISDSFFMMNIDQAALAYFDADDTFGVQKRLGIDPLLFKRVPDHALYAAFYGFSVADILGAARARTKSDLVDVFHSPADFKIIQAPVSKRLSRRQLTLQLQADAFEEVMVVQGKSWRPLSKRGAVHGLTFVPVPGELVVMGRRANHTDYDALLAYTVR